MVEAGDSVQYHDGVRSGPATVVSVNEDGTVNLLYQHPSGAVDDAGDPVLATADNCQEGTGGYQYSTGETPPRPEGEQGKAEGWPPKSAKEIPQDPRAGKGRITE